MKLYYDLFEANLGGEMRHAQVVMDELGITYGDAIPQSMMDSWIFVDCQNVPSPLPAFLRQFPFKDASRAGKGET